MPKLEIGSGNNPTPGYEHLDFQADAIHVEYKGDFRALFAPDYELDQFPDLLKLSEDTFDEIKAVHFVEHVEWIYQEAMFKTFWSLLKPFGRIFIVTPNLTWILNAAIVGFERYGSKWLSFRRRRAVPLDNWQQEHPLLESQPESLIVFVKWLNFKLYSGCSRGDYHHCCYTAELLKHVLETTGFSGIRIRGKRSYTLEAQAVAIK